MAGTPRPAAWANHLRAAPAYVSHVPAALVAERDCRNSGGRPDPARYSAANEAKKRRVESLTTLCARAWEVRRAKSAELWRSRSRSATRVRSEPAVKAERDYDTAGPEVAAVLARDAQAIAGRAQADKAD